MSAPVSFALPFPPSVNGLFAGKARRYASPAYKAWKAAARPHVPAGLIAGPYTLDLIFDRPDRRARDLGNLEKAVSDLIVERGLVIDDSCCQRITLAWSDEPPQRDSVVRVTVTPHSKSGE
jgi:crossover junction endodeoxyribonuclease RusA